MARQTPVYDLLMEKYLNQFPKPVVAVVVISLAIAVIYFSNPPRSICDAEKDAFQETLKGELYPERIDKKKGRLPPQIRQAQVICKQGNNSGACYEYFNMLKNISREIKRQTTECYTTVIEAPGVLPSLKEGLMLMSQLSWGEEPPEDSSKSWFTHSDLSAFCAIKDILKESVEEEEWAEFVAQVLASLPGAKPTDAIPGVIDPRPRPTALQLLGDKQVFSKSLMSLNCRAYL